VSWPFSRLDQLADAVLGKMLDKQKNRGTPRPYLRNINVRWGTFDLSDVQQMPFEDHETARFSVQRGDLVVCEGGEPGRCAVWSREDPIFIQKAVHRVRCGEKLNPMFLAYWLRHLAASGELADLTTGTTIQHLPGVTLAALRVPHPPVHEQHRIVATIETQLSRLDAAVASLTRAKANVKRARASVLKAAVEGRLVPTEAALARTEGRDYEPAVTLLARILVERQAAWTASGAKGKYKEPVAPETEGLHKLPEGWCWTSLGHAFAVEVGATPSRQRADYWGGDVPWASSGEVQFCRIKHTRESITQAGLANASTKLHPKGTVLLGMIGQGRTRGQVAILDIEACNNQNCAAIRVSDAGCVPEYVYAWLELQYDETRRLGGGNNQQALNKARVEAILFPLPPLAEQRRIVAEADRRLSVLDTLDTTLDANLARCKRLRQSILKRAFEGQLVPAEAPHGHTTSKARAPQLPLFEGASG
jgi:type I restriction enzyme S subunit